MKLIYTSHQTICKNEKTCKPENEKHVFASVQYLRKKLIEKYGEEEIGFANMSNRSDVLYFKKTLYLIELYIIAGRHKDATM